MAHIASGAVCCFVGVVRRRYQTHGCGGFVVCKAQLIHLKDRLAALLFPIQKARKQRALTMVAISVIVVGLDEACGESWIVLISL